MANFIYRQRTRNTLLFGHSKPCENRIPSVSTPQATIDFRRKSFYNKLRNQETKK